MRRHEAMRCLLLLLLLLRTPLARLDASDGARRLHRTRR